MRLFPSLICLLHYKQKKHRKQAKNETGCLLVLVFEDPDKDEELETLRKRK